MSDKSNESRSLDPESMEEAALRHSDTPLVFARLVLGYAISLKRQLAKRFLFLTDVDIEDVVSNTVLQVYEERDKYDSAKASIRRWLTMKAYYQVLTLARQRRLLPTCTLTGLEETLAARSESVSDDNTESTSLALEEWLQQLPPQRKKVIQLYRQGVPESEIAQQLGIKRGTVRVHIYQGIKHLRQLRQNAEGNE